VKSSSLNAILSVPELNFVGAGSSSQLPRVGRDCLFFAYTTLHSLAEVAERSSGTHRQHYTTEYRYMQA